jgi:two-component system sensor histidine kinase KdpD
MPDLLPRERAGSPRRVGYPAAIVVLAATTLFLRLMPSLSTTSADLVLLLAVFLVARLWETGPGVTAALLGTAALRYYFVAPFHSFRLANAKDELSLLVFLVAALLVGRLSAQSRQRLERLEEERLRLATVAGLSQAFLADTGGQALVPLAADRLRSALACERVAILLDEAGELRVATGNDDPALRPAAERVRASGRAERIDRSGGAHDLVLPLLAGDRSVGVLVAAGSRADERVAEACAVVLALALEHDRTQRLATDAEAVQVREEMKSTLLATLGHDLKTPVSVAGGALENWEARAGACEESRLASGSLATLGRVVDELLTVIRLEAGVGGPHKQRTSCGEIVDAAIARIADALDGRRLDVEPVHPGLEVVADPAQIAEALRLGLENAFAHTPRSASVRVAVEDMGRDVVFAVEDDGPGIPEPDRRRVLQKFVRLTGSRDTPGTGLGLYIAKTLSEMNDGRLEIGSAPSGGTRFAIALPGLVEKEVT